LIERRSESLDDVVLDRYYFRALTQVLKEGEPSIGASPRIWLHELEWRERHTARLGYLFFGAPNERPTAWPPRDFYLYFLPPLRPPPFKDEKKADEVLFTFTGVDESFAKALRSYSGALELAATASGQPKAAYEAKAGDHLRTLVAWLQSQLTSSFEVRYQGRERPLLEWLRGRISSPAGA